jgi:hypothetical protein
MCAHAQIVWNPGGRIPPDATEEQRMKPATILASEEEHADDLSSLLEGIKD